REEVGRVRRHGLVVGLPRGELLPGRQPRVVLLGRRDLRVVSVWADVRCSEHKPADLAGMTKSEARGRQRAETESPDVDGVATRDPIDELSDVIGEAFE